MDRNRQYLDAIDVEVWVRRAPAADAVPVESTTLPEVSAWPELFDLKAVIAAARPEVRAAYALMRQPPRYQLYDLQADPFEFPGPVTRS